MNKIIITYRGKEVTINVTKAIYEGWIEKIDKSDYACEIVSHTWVTPSKEKPIIIYESYTKNGGLTYANYLYIYDSHGESTYYSLDDITNVTCDDGEGLSNTDKILWGLGLLSFVKAKSDKTCRKQVEKKLAKEANND